MIIFQIFNFLFCLLISVCGPFLWPHMHCAVYILSLHCLLLSASLTFLSDTFFWSSKFWTFFMFPKLNVSLALWSLNLRSFHAREAKTMLEPSENETSLLSFFFVKRKNYAVHDKILHIDWPLICFHFSS